MSREADLLVNIDVPDLAAGVAFYTEALGLARGRSWDGLAELTGRAVPIFLIEKQAGTSIGPDGGDTRRYSRHWCPIHPDFAVDDLDAAIMRVEQAGAVREGDVMDLPYGRQAMFADPFGNGFCLIQFNKDGYDALRD